MDDHGVLPDVGQYAKLHLSCREGVAGLLEGVLVGAYQ